MICLFSSGYKCIITAEIRTYGYRSKSKTSTDTRGLIKHLFCEQYSRETFYDLIFAFFPSYTVFINKFKEYLIDYYYVVRKDIDVNEHEKLCPTIQ